MKVRYFKGKCNLTCYGYFGNLTGCCEGSNCDTSCCMCDEDCHIRGDCCMDIEAWGCSTSKNGMGLILILMI